MVTVMKRFVCLAPLLALATGCHVITLTTPQGGTAKVSSFGQKASLGSLEYDPNTGRLLVTNYNLDQVSGIQAVGQIAIQAAQAGAFAAQHTTNQPPVKP